MTGNIAGLMFTDFHAHLFKDFSKPDPEFHTDRFRDQLATLETILKRAQELKVPVIFGGDLFHKRIYVDSRVFNPIFDMIAKYSDVQVILVRGNHDSVTNSLHSISSLDTLSNLPNVVVFTEPSYLEVGTGETAFMLHGLPYGEEIADMKMWLNNSVKQMEKFELPNLLVAHIGVDGATVGQYSHTLEGAFTVGDLHPDKFDYIYLGHYHKRQELAPNVIYGGNTIQTSFSDEGQTKGYHELLISEDGTMSTNYVEIPNKMFITVTGDNIPDNDILENNYIRFTGTEEQAKVVNDIVSTGGLTNVRVTVQRDYSEESRLGVTADTSEEDILTSYVALKELPDTLGVKALECLREAKNDK